MTAITDRRKLVQYIVSLGWVSVGGEGHEKFVRNGIHIAVPYKHKKDMNKILAMKIAKQAEMK